MTFPHVTVLGKISITTVVSNTVQYNTQRFSVEFGVICNTHVSNTGSQWSVSITNGQIKPVG